MAEVLTTEEMLGGNRRKDCAGPTATAIVERTLSNGTTSVVVAAAAFSGSSTKQVVNSVLTEKLVNANTARMHISTEEGIILLKDVVSCGTHIAKYGSVQNKFHDAANSANADPGFLFPFKTRAIQEKVGKMMKEFRQWDARDRAKSGTADGLSPIDELLSSVVDAGDDMRESDKKEKEDASRAERRKLEAGRRVIAEAVHGTSSCNVDDDEDEVEVV